MPPVAAPAPAAAPSKSAAPPKPAPPSPPTSAPPDNPVDAGDAGSELDALSAAEETPRKAPERPSGEVKPPEGEKPAGKAPEKPAGAPEPEPKTNKELRGAYDKLKERVAKEIEPALAKAQARIKELETSKPQDLTPLQEKLTATEKRNAELESHIQFVDYTKSKEYQDKYHQPYVEAWNKALAEMDELTVELGDGSSRKATEKDLITLSNMPLGEARKLANQMFGDAADDVMAHRRKVRELADAENKALDDAKKKAGDHAKQNELLSKTHSEQRNKLWAEANSTQESANPKWNERIKSDEELSKARSKGLALADRLFSPTPETQPKTPQEAVQIHAEIRHKVGNYEPLLVMLKRTRSELAEVKASLAEFEKSKPSGGHGGGPQGGATDGDDWEAEIERLASKNR